MKHYFKKSIYSAVFSYKMGDFQYLYFIPYFALYFVERKKKNLEQLNMLITLIHVLSHSTTVTL